MLGGACGGTRRGDEGSCGTVGATEGPPLGDLSTTYARGRGKGKPNADFCENITTKTCVKNSTVNQIGHGQFSSGLVNGWYCEQPEKPQDREKVVAFTKM